MRQRTLLVLTWLLATAVATGVGFLAVFLVGDVVRGAGPLGASFETPSPQPEVGSSVAVRRVVQTEHVRLVAECRGREAVLLAADPVPPWELADREVGPDEDVEAVLTQGSSRVRVEVYCNRGEPREVVFD